MEEMSESLRLEIRLNGKRLFIVGLGGAGCLSLELDINDLHSREIQCLPPEPIEPRAVLRLYGSENDDERLLEWIRGQDLQPGAELTIRVMGPGPFDSPERTDISGLDD